MQSTATQYGLTKVESASRESCLMLEEWQKGTEDGCRVFGSNERGLWSVALAFSCWLPFHPPAETPKAVKLDETSDLSHQGMQGAAGAAHRSS